MSPVGTSRYLTTTQHFDRFPGEADEDRQAQPVCSVENDPKADMTVDGNTALFLASIRYLAGAPPSVLKSFIGQRVT